MPHQSCSPLLPPPSRNRSRVRQIKARSPFMKWKDTPAAHKGPGAFPVCDKYAHLFIFQNWIFLERSLPCQGLVAWRGTKEQRQWAKRCSGIHGGQNGHGIPMKGKDSSKISGKTPALMITSGRSAGLKTRTNSERPNLSCIGGAKSAVSLKHPRGHFGDSPVFFKPGDIRAGTPVIIPGTIANGTNAKASVTAYDTGWKKASCSHRIVNTRP